MSDANKTNTEISPVVGWLVGGFLVAILIFWNHAGGSRTLWWLCWLIGPVVVFFLLHSLKYLNIRSAALTNIVGFLMVCCLIVSGLALLIGSVVVVGVVAKTIFGSSHSYEDEELPDNWRR